MSKENKKSGGSQGAEDAKDPLLNLPADTRTDREKFVDEFTQRYQDKNPHDQADAILWAIEEMIARTMTGEIPEA